MTPPLRDDEPLNLDTRSLEEMGRIPDCRGTEPEPPLPENRPEQLGPHFTPRCETSQREILRNCFPADLR